MSDERHARGVAGELLVPEIEALRGAATRYGRAVDAGTDAAGGVGLDLEVAAIRYVRKLDDEARKANSPDYLAIVEAAERGRERSGN